jgi:MazG family protein
MVGERCEQWRMSSTPDDRSDRRAPPPGPSAPPGADHAATTPGSLDRALALVRFLRAHCPWDAAQTAESLIPHLVEETQEVVDAIHHDDAGELEGELGDLLLNLAFQIVVAEEDGRLTADSVTRRLEAKMRRRHPHLYGDGPREEWEAIKARERADRDGGDRSGILDGMAASLDPLTTAHRMQERVARVGFDWEDHRGALAKVAEEVEEVREALAGASAPRIEEELGDLLFAVVNLVRLTDQHPTRALVLANRKFRRRFGALEGLARERDVVLGEASLAELDALWEELKVREKEAPPGSGAPGQGAR